jgi:hypothetical protein
MRATFSHTHSVGPIGQHAPDLNFWRTSTTGCLT